MTLTNAENPKKVKAMKLLYLFVFAICILVVSALLSFILIYLNMPLGMT